MQIEFIDNKGTNLSAYPKYENGDRIRIHDIDFGNGDKGCGYSIGHEGVIEDDNVKSAHEMGVYFVRFDNDPEVTCVCVEDMQKVNSED